MDAGQDHQALSERHLEVGSSPDCEVGTTESFACGNTDSPNFQNYTEAGLWRGAVLAGLRSGSYSGTAMANADAVVVGYRKRDVALQYGAKLRALRERRQ